MICRKQLLFVGALLGSMGALYAELLPDQGKDSAPAMENMWRPHMFSAKYTDTAYWLEITEKHHVPLAGPATYLTAQATQGNMRAKVLYIALCNETTLITDAYDCNKTGKIYYDDERCQKNQMMKKLGDFAARQQSAAYNVVFREWAQYTLNQQPEESFMPEADGTKPSGACVPACIELSCHTSRAQVA